MSLADPGHFGGSSSPQKQEIRRATFSVIIRRQSIKQVSGVHDDHASKRKAARAVHLTLPSLQCTFFDLEANHVHEKLGGSWEEKGSLGTWQLIP